MKKYLLLASVAALAFTSCSDQSTEFVGDEAAQKAREISFSPIARPITRSAASGAQTSAGFPEETIYVSAYQSAPTDQQRDYFGNIAFNKQAAPGTKWSGSQYWPLAVSTFNFLAVTEGPASSVITFGDNGSDYAKQVEVNMTDNITTQHDLMYSYARASVTQTGTDGVLTFPDVPMTFHHALSWVNFTVRAFDATTAGAGIVLKNITLNNAVYKGKYNVVMTNYDESDNTTKALDVSSAAWDRTQYTTDKGTATVKNVLDADGSIAVNVYDSANPIAVENADPNVKKGVLVVPNPNLTSSVLDPSFDNITIKYEYKGSTYQYTYAPTDRAMEPGKKYTYNIIFKLHEILVVPSVEDWDTSSGARDVTIL